MPCMKRQPAQSGYMEENASLACEAAVLPGFLLQSFHGALCTEQWISVLCAGCDSLFTFSQGKLAAAVRPGLPIRAQASADPDLCLFTQPNFLQRLLKGKSHTHLRSNSVK